MLFSYNWIGEHIKGKLPLPQKVMELLTMHNFEVEEIEQKNNDWIFDISILAHRGDALGHRGLARELAATLKKNLIPLKKNPIKAKKGTLKPLKVQVNSPDVIRYSALVVENVKIQKSPQWIKDRLESLGINSINSVVDVTNYIMEELGQPLHAFDYDKIKNHTLIVRESKEGEIVETLDDLTFKLPKGILVAKDQKRLIDLAGIKGGKLSAIDSETTNIVLQAATFNGSKIYQTKKELGYSTPAADMYMHGLDPNLTMSSLEYAAELLAKLSGGTVVQVIDIYKKKENPSTLLVDLSIIEQSLGTKLTKTIVKNILQSLEFGIQGAGNILKVTVPTFRKDVKLPEDIIEEVGKIFGYEKIKPEFPVLPLISPEENPALILEEQLKDSLKEAGYTETYNYSFIGEKDLETFMFQKKDKEKLVTLENPYSEDFKYLRSTLLENLLKATSINARSFLGKDMRLFEIGKAFQKQKEGILEYRMIAGVIALPVKKNQSFYEAKGVIDFIFSCLGIPGVWYDDFEQTPEHTREELWHKKKSAEIKIGDVKVGFLGIIPEVITSNLKISHEVAGFVLDIEKLLSFTAKEKYYQAVPRYPASFRDLALLVPKNTKIAEVMNCINAAGGNLLVDIDLFDIYEGEHIPSGKKNLAFHLIYQAENHTLVAYEIDALHEKIISTLEENPEWEIRK